MWIPPRNFHSENDHLMIPGAKWGPQTIAKLVHITAITMVYGTYNYSIHGVYKPSEI